MAESLGTAVLTVSVDDTQLKAGLQAAEKQAAATGRAVDKAFTPTGRSVQTAANGLQYFIDAQGRARDTAGKFLTVAQKQAAGIENIGSSALSAGISLRNLASSLAGLGIGGAAAGFAQSSVNAAVELESITKKLSNTLGPQGAGQALGFTKGLADQLGLSFKTLASSFGSFTAAATAANVPIGQQRDLFAAVAKAAQALGLSNDEINGSLLALQQVAAKGTVQMEELRGQLGERLPIAFGATARGLGLTQQELIKLVETGRLTANEFFPALTKGLNELTEGAGGAPTAAQNFQKLANAWDELQTSFGQSLLPTITQQVKNLTDALNSIPDRQTAASVGLGSQGGPFGPIFSLFNLNIPEGADKTVAALKKVQQEFGLTAKQSRALFTDAVAAQGGSYNIFGELVISSKQLEAALKNLPGLAEQFRAKNRDVVGELKAQLAEQARLAIEEKKRRDSVENISEKLKSLSSEQKGLAVDGQRYADIAQEIVNTQTRLNELKKTESQRWAESIAAANQLKSIQEDIAIEQQGRGLTGLGRGALQALKQLEDAKRAEQNAQAALRANPGSPDLLNAAQQASASVQLAAERSKTSLQDAFRSAQDAVKNIQRGIEDSVTSLQELTNDRGAGLNPFLSAQTVSDRQASLSAELGPIVEGLRKQLGIEQLRFSGTREDINRQQLQFIKAARQDIRQRQDLTTAREVDLPRATADLAVVSESLVRVNSELAAATNALAQKDWNVYVTTPATTDLSRGVEVYQ